METTYESCAGLDVHKKTVEVTVRRMEGGQLHAETRRFATLTRDLLRVSEWLASQKVTHVAMESTGVFWKPIYNILEGSFEVLLVNAQHVKQVPGRKTDVKDSQWLAQLLQHGLLRPSFVPPRPVRELRDLTRHRTQLVAEKVRVANRLRKTLEDANIKLGSVASDLMGVSARAMLQALIRGEADPARIAGLARRSMRSKIPQLKVALEGRITDHHRFLLQVLWDQLQSLESLMGRLDARIEELLRPLEKTIQRLDEVPGIDRRVAEIILAEMGTDMKVFPTARHLASWAGMCPGNHESAGKRKTGKTTHGSRWLRGALTQAAWAASHDKNSYFAAQYRRLAARRGKKRALVAVGHSILVAVYHLLRQSDLCYRDLGADFFDRLDPQRLTKHRVRRLEGLGHKVTLTPVAA
ncbi:MAG: IS110 family transposase [Nitrospira sp.]|nr:IS110 family transposase [Nitrospira sp.]